jgi:type VI secretion system protein ImpH
MAAQGSRENLALIERLLAEPYRFEFFQAVRILERAADTGLARELGGSTTENTETTEEIDGVCQKSHSSNPKLFSVSSVNSVVNRPEVRGHAVVGGRARRRPIGYDSMPVQEAVRFRASPTLGFPASEVVNVRNGAAADAGDSTRPSPPPEMVVTFMGLTGPSGTLPLHYTRLLIERIREKDLSLRDFFDLFNHRLISLFFRAWEKYRIPSAYQRARSRTDDESIAPGAARRLEDAFTFCLYCLAGLGTGGLRSRLKVHDESFVHYGGLFADAHRNAISLQRMVADYFDLPAAIDQFRGQWLYLGLDDVSRMADAENPLGQNCRLGIETVLGNRVWDVQSRFRVRLGPLTYVQYCRFTPDGDGLEPICQLVRMFAGPEFDFDIQPVLMASEVPATRIGSVMEVKPRLGWNVWLKSQEAEQDFADAAFGASD